MHLAHAARRTVAVAAATALLTTGGAAGGLLSSAALAAPGDPVVTAITPNADNNSGSTAITLTGSSFLPATDDILLRPAAAGGPSGPGVHDIDPTEDQASSTTTSFKATAPLTIEAPGAYDVVIARGTTEFVFSCPDVCFTVTSNGVPDVSGVVAGASTGNTGRGARALDISGSFFARGAKASFLKADGTPDAGLAFTPGDPNNTTTGGFINSGLIRGNYSFPAATTFTPGKHALRLTNTDGQSGATVEFWQPTFLASGVSPSSRGAGSQNQVITVTGQGIRQGSKLGVQDLDTSSASDVSVGQSTVNATGTQISAPVSFTTNAQTGTGRAVSITGPDGGTYNVPSAFTLTGAPAISQLSPNALGQGASVDLSITGTDFAPGGAAGLPQFTFSGLGVTTVTKKVVITPANPADPTSTDTTTATVTVTVARDATLGGRSVTVTNPDGGSSTLGQNVANAFPFTVNVGPSIASVSPASAPRSTTRTVTLKGADLDSTNGINIAFSIPPATGQPRTTDTTVSVGTITVTNGANGAADTATFPVTISGTAPYGLRDLVLTNKGDFGSVLCAGCFGVDSLSVPTANGNAAGSNSGTKTVLFTGSGIPAGSAVQLVRAGDPSYQPHLNGSNVAVAADGSSLTALFDLTNAAPGPYNAIVTSGTTTLSCASCYTVTGSTPTLTSLAPASGGQGAVNRAVTLTGTKFSRGMQVTIAGLNVHDVTFVSPTSLTALIDIPAATTTGAKDVKLTNADGVGTVTLTGGYTVTSAPTVSTVSPTSLGQGAALQDVTITGPGFAGPGAAQSTVSFGPGITVTKVVVTQGTDVPVVNPNADDTMVATISIAEAAAATQRDVVVSNPDGGVGTLAKGFTVNPGPKVTDVSPAALAPGSSGKTLTINGSGFSTTSGKTAAPKIDGVTLTNVVVAADGRSITATAAVAANQARGVKTVVVTNPTDQGVGTCPGCFAIAVAPGAPASLSVTGGGTSLIATWTAPTDDGGSPITSYVASARTINANGTPGAPAGTSATVSGTARTATITGLAQGTTYQVSVIARNAIGDGVARQASGSTSAKTATRLTSLHSPSLTVTGQTVRLSGRLVRAGSGLPIVGARLDLGLVPDVGRASFQHPVTDANGGWSYTFAPTYSQTIRTYFPGDSDDAAVFATTYRMGVSTKVTVTSPASGATTSVRSPLRVTGTTSPNKAGYVVYLNRYSGGKYVGFAAARVASNGTYVITANLARGDYLLKVSIGRTTGNFVGYSPAFSSHRR